MLPPEVLHEFSKSVINYKKTGYSILELPHRSTAFMDIMAECTALVKELCRIGDDFEVLWMQGGGRAQFGMVPMNFLGPNDVAGYIDSGHWAAEAAAYAMMLNKNTSVLSSTKAINYCELPSINLKLPAKLKYLHLTTNNTIYGTQFSTIPDFKVPVVADMSSDIFSVQRDYSKFGLFYAVAQKNLGTPGTTMVAVRKDFLANQQTYIAPAFSYTKHLQAGNLLNTPNVSGIYVTLLMLRWTKQQGLAAIEKNNREKAALLYNAIDANKTFVPHVKKTSDRSLMNVCFTMNNKDAEARFVKLCEQEQIVGIEGHRSVGGFRVSLYNAVTTDHVKTLVEIIEKI